MGIFDKAKDALSEHKDKVDEGIGKLGDLVDEKTGDKYTSQVDQGEALAKDRLGDYLGGGENANEPGSDPKPV
jgi:hypothetical protein